MPEALAFQPTQRSPELVRLAAHYLRAKLPVGTFSVAGQAQGLRHIQHDGYRQAVMLPGQLHQGLAGLRLYAGGVNDSEASGSQARGRDEVEQGKGVGCCGLVGGVIRHHRPAGVRRHHFRGPEVAGGKRGFPRSRWANERHQAQFGNGDLHLVKTPI